MKPEYPLPPVNDSNQLGVPDRGSRKVRCFVTNVEVSKPSFNLYASIVRFQADHAERTDFQGSFSVPDGRKYNIGDVIFVTIDTEGI